MYPTSGATLRAALNLVAREAATAANDLIEAAPCMVGA